MELLEGEEPKEGFEEREGGVDWGERWFDCVFGGVGRGGGGGWGGCWGAETEPGESRAHSSWVRHGGGAVGCGTSRSGVGCEVWFVAFVAVGGGGFSVDFQSYPFWIETGGESPRNWDGEGLLGREEDRGVVVAYIKFIASDFVLMAICGFVDVVGVFWGLLCAVITVHHSSWCNCVQVSFKEKHGIIGLSIRAYVQNLPRVGVKYLWDLVNGDSLPISCHFNVVVGTRLGFLIFKSVHPVVI